MIFNFLAFKIYFFTSNIFVYKILIRKRQFSIALTRVIIALFGEVNEKGHVQFHNQLK